MEESNFMGSLFMLCACMLKKKYYAKIICSVGEEMMSHFQRNPVDINLANTKIAIKVIYLEYEISFHEDTEIIMGRLCGITQSIPYI